MISTSQVCLQQILIDCLTGQDTIEKEWNA